MKWGNEIDIRRRHKQQQQPLKLSILFSLGSFSVVVESRKFLLSRLIIIGTQLRRRIIAMGK